MKFLAALIDKMPPSVFDKDAMGLVLRVMWKDHIRFFFLADVVLIIVLYALWIVYLDWTASTAESSTGMPTSCSRFAYDQFALWIERSHPV
jgi:hypothetical protein